MDPLLIIKEIGLPAAFCLALGWFIYRQNNYIQNDLAKDLHKKFAQLEHIINDDLRLIIIALINQQKKMQIELRGIKSKYEALVDIIMKLMEVKDKNEEKRE
tara:strand:+ start:503 stop:808 length:306 start_codon:yes stop_codon:yes gene_type:complete